ncbi:MAG: DUF1320 domain-containing protein [Carboxylicivirga sp.]|jgi:phage gp36-like protein|nr:DUF1320 domain-containing protein [Carboxylicivirga sp.]
MFLEEADLGQSIYDEILQAISRQDPLFIEGHISDAIADVDSYINQKYDTSQLWLQSGEERNRSILKICRDMALYNIHSVLEEVPVIRRERNDNALQLLRGIRDGKNYLAGVPLLSEQEESTDNEITSGSNSRRY